MLISRTGRILVSISAQLRTLMKGRLIDMNPGRGLFLNKIEVESWLLFYYFSLGWLNQHFFCKFRYRFKNSFLSLEIPLGPPWLHIFLVPFCPLEALSYLAFDFIFVSAMFIVLISRWWIVLSPGFLIGQKSKILARMRRQTENHILQLLTVIITYLALT